MVYNIIGLYQFPGRSSTEFEFENMVDTAFELNRLRSAVRNKINLNHKSFSNSQFRSCGKTKTNEFKTAVDSSDFDVIALTET